MNIAILLLNQGRGSGEVAREHAEHLAARGNKVYFMHPKVKQLKNVECVDIELISPIMPVHEYLPAAKKTQKAVSIMPLEEVNAYVADYEKALENIIDDVDIIIGHHANLTAIATHRVAKKHGKPYVLFVHGTGIEPRFSGGYDDKVWALIKQAIEQAQGILVTTDYVRDSLVRPLVDVPFEKFKVLPCGVDLEDFYPEKTGDVIKKYNLPEKYVICPGALMHVKGPQNIVEATEYYSDVAETIFIGDGELREELEQKLGKRGRFLGFVSAEDKANLINSATVLTAAPEKKEHFGIIYAEALAGGTPVVAYEGGGVASIVIPETGILTERNNRLLGEKIKELLQKPETCKKMAVAGRERAEKLYSYPLIVKELEEWMMPFL